MAAPLQHSVSLLGLFAVLSIFGCRCHRTPKSEPPRPASQRVTPLSKRFGADQPFAFVMPQLKAVDGVGGVRAKDCGVCHQAIYKEWQQSSHAWALRDIQYQAELFKPSSPRWLCLNCHIPVQNQRRGIVTGLIDRDVMRPATRPNPGFDPAMQQEAITCAVCHVRKDAEGHSQIIGPRGNTEAPHPVRRDAAGLRRSCLRCHDPKGQRITPLLVCWFKTREELAQSPYAGKQGCVDCHMPAVRRRLAEELDDFPVRETRAHHWAGGGVPKSFAGYAGLRARGYEPGLKVDELKVSRSPDGKQVELTLAYENARAGHWLPTADPERHLLLLAWLEDAKGRRYAAARARIGQTWSWSPRAEKRGDNRLKPKERRRWSKRLSIPGKLGAGGKLVVTVYHVRLTSKTARHMSKTRVEETYVKGIARLVRELPRHYPGASYLFREEVDLATGKRTRATPEQLIELSRAEQDKPLSARDY